jgi:hypothetical protein
MNQYALLALLVLASYAYAGESPLPAEAQLLVDKAAVLDDSIQNKADQEKSKVSKTLLQQLTKLQEAYTKKGDLNSALGIKAEIDRQTEAANTRDNLLGEGRAIDLAKVPWLKLSGKPYSVPSDKPLVIEIPKAAMIIPNPESRWGGGGSKGSSTCSFSGYKGDGTGWMSLKATRDGQRVDLSKPTFGTITLMAEDGNPDGNTGSVDIKVVVVN